MKKSVLAELRKTRKVRIARPKKSVEPVLVTQEEQMANDALMAEFEKELDQEEEADFEALRNELDSQALLELEARTSRK